MIIGTMKKLERRQQKNCIPFLKSEAMFANARILPPFAQAVSAEQTKGGKTACANGVQECVRLSTLRRITKGTAQEASGLDSGVRAK